MTPQDIAQVVADAVEREGLDADEVLFRVASELLTRCTDPSAPAPPLLAMVAMAPGCPPVCVSCGEPRDRADSDQCGSVGASNSDHLRGIDGAWSIS